MREQMTGQGKAGADTGTERDADGTKRPIGCSGRDFAQQESGGIVDKAHLPGAPAKTGGQSLPQIDATEVRELVFHAADTGFIVEWSGHRQLRSPHRPCIP